MKIKKIFWVILIVAFATVNAGSLENKITQTDATDLALQTFAEDNGLHAKDIEILDTSVYSSAFSDKKWFVVKLRSKDKSRLITIDSSTGAVARGWDSIEEHEQKNKRKINPILNSILNNKSLKEEVDVIIVLKDQPKVRDIAIKAENSYSEQLVNAISNKDERKIKEIQSKVREKIVSDAKEFNLAHGQSNVMRSLTNLKASEIDPGSIRNHIVAKVPVKEITTLAQLPDVETIEPILEAKAQLDVSTHAINANMVWPYVQGNNWTSRAGVVNEVSIFDSGIDSTHPALAAAVTGNWNYVPDHETTTNDLQGHGTHVAGIAGSRNTTYRGVATGVYLLNEKVAYRTANGNASSPWDAVIEALNHSYTYSSEIVQYSYGLYPPDSWCWIQLQPGSCDYYSNANGNSELSRTFDAYVEAGLLSVVSAGNNGPANDTINVPGDAYNVITVGSYVTKDHWSDLYGNIWVYDPPVNVGQISPFSSRGYTGDGRTKPDVVAPGQAIVSTASRNASYDDGDVVDGGTHFVDSNGTPTGGTITELTSGWVKMQGTSMAAPHVSGLVALLVDQWAYLYSERFSGQGFVYGGPLAIRAIIYNSADETTGETIGSMNDRISGTGYVDAYLAYQQANKTKVKIMNLAGTNSYEQIINVNPGDVIKATITWNRHVDIATITPRDISDIDLELLDSNGNVLASSFDASTNWEKISYIYPGASPTTLRIRVYPSVSIPSNIGTETIALAFTPFNSISGRSGGPDNFGYTFKDSNTPGGPTYDWIEINTTGTKILNNSDDIFLDNIPVGFFFNFYGTDYSRLSITNNGLLLASGGTSQYTNQPIGNTTPHNFIAPFWDDIVTWGSGTTSAASRQINEDKESKSKFIASSAVSASSSTPGAIYYQTLGTAPNRMFVVEWYDNQHYSTSPSGVTFEAILYEGTNNIKFQYKDVDFGYTSYNNGGSATVGIEGPDGRGLQYSYDQQVLSPGLAILFKFPQYAGTNLYLSKQAPASKDRNTTMIYTLYYHNFGDTAAANVVLNDTPPPEVEFISASHSGSYNPITRKVTWNIGSVAPGGHGYENVTVRINRSVAIGTVIQNRARINTSNLEVRYDDNEAQAGTGVTGTTLPPDVSVEPNNGGTTPSVVWHTPITFTYYSSCATSVGINIHISDGGPDITGTMTETSPDTWTYTTSFSRTGTATVTYTVSGCTEPTVSFNIYIDPAGYIYDINTGTRIAGASVWLQRPDGQGGWENVPTGQTPPVMQPDVNPLITGADGQYQWDVIPGSYRVHVEASGYYPADSIVVSIPPPVTDLHVGLTHIPLNISGYKINDTNGNGLWNSGEQGIQGWNITLRNVTTGEAIYNTSTNGAGFYQFSNLPAGRYNVTEETRSGWFSTNTTFKVVNLTSQDIINLNFTNSNAIRGDVNRNGRRDTGDATLILRSIVGLPIPSQYLPILPIGDMNCNSRIDTGDATLVLRDVVGLPIPGC